MQWCFGTNRGCSHGDLVLTESDIMHEKRSLLHVFEIKTEMIPDKMISN